MRKIILILLFILSFTKINYGLNNNFDEHLKIKISSYNDGFNLSTTSGFQVLENNMVIDTIYDNVIELKYENGTTIHSDSQVFGPYNFVKIRPISGFLNYNNHEYEGDFYLLEKDKSLINEIELEKYIYSVVANEVGSTFEIESIKAQAVAARTYALYNSKMFIKDGYNLTADAISQVYNGRKKVDNKIVLAVDETRGEIVVYDGEPIDATYSSTSGGSTASAKDTWGEHRPYLIGKNDPYSLNSPRVDWEYSLTLNEIDELISKGTNKTGFKSIILHKNELGRVTDVDMFYENGKVTVRPERFRSRLGISNIKSTKFDVIGSSVSSNASYYDLIPNSCPINPNYNSSEIVINNSSNNDIVKFVGKGVGHGVGMSQYGANEMAKKNFNYRDILKFYYEGVEIEKIYD